MTDQLITKIQHVLDRPIRNEMQVVYLLVELRKLMDRERYDDGVLRTFANWVVHTDLNRSGIEILTDFDRHLARSFEKNRTGVYPEHLGLHQFRASLIHCFEHFGLSATCVYEPKEWERFCQYYFFVVSECPIRFSNKMSPVPLKYVKTVELSGVGPLPFRRRGLPVVGWKVTLIDGRELNWIFNMK